MLIESLDNFRIMLYLPYVKIAIISLSVERDQNLESALEWFFSEGGGLVALGLTASKGSIGTASETVFPIFATTYRTGTYDASVGKFTMTHIKEDEDEISRGLSDFTIPDHKILLSFNTSTQAYLPRSPEAGDYKVLFRERGTGAPSVVKYQNQGVSVTFACFGGDDYDWAFNYFGQFAGANCVLSSLMPHDYTNFRRTNRFYQIRLVESGLPPVFTVFRDLGIEEYVGLWVRQLFPREGSTIWAWASPMSDHPFFISWQIGDGKAITSVVAQDLDEPWWGSDHRGASSGNPYGGDLLLNIIYWSVGRRPIEDIELVHAVRKAYEAFAQERRMILSLVDYIDKMGASGRPVEQGLDDIIPLRREARSLYVEEEYAQALGHMMVVKEAMKDLQAMASKLCKRAMVWVYVVDWLAITGTSMVCVFLLWSLMVRRSLYREVGTTRTK